MVDNVQLNDVPLASRGNPNLIPSLARPLGTVRRVLSGFADTFEKDDPVDTTLADFQQRVSTIAQGVAQGSIKRADSQIMLSALQKSFSAGKDAETVRTIETLRKSALSREGVIGQHQLQDISFEELQAQESAKFILENVQAASPDLIDSPRAIQKKAVSDYTNRIAQFNVGAVKLNNLKQDLDLDETQKVKGQLDAIKDMTNGSVLQWTAEINKILKGVTPSSPAEQKAAAIEALHQKERELNIALEGNFKELINSGRIDGIIAMRRNAFDKARDSVSGDEQLKIYQNSSTLLTEAAYLGMLDDPEVVKTVVLWDKVLGKVPGDVLIGKDNAELRLSFVPGFKVFMDLANSVSGKSIVDLSDDEKRSAVSNFIKRITDPAVLKEVESDPEARKSFITGMINFTNEMTTAGEEVHPEVYSTTFNLISKSLDTAKSLYAFEGGEKFLENVKNGLLNYSDSLAQVLSDNLKAALDSNTVQKIHSKYLESKGVANPFKTHFIRTGDLLNIEATKDGGLFFSIKEGIDKVPSLTKTVTNLNKMYGKEFKQLVRAYAHTNNSDEKYSDAMFEMITNHTGLSQIFEQPEGKMLTIKPDTSFSLLPRSTLKDLNKSKVTDQLTREELLAQPPKEDPVPEAPFLSVDEIRHMHETQGAEATLKWLYQVHDIKKEDITKVIGEKVPEGLGQQKNPPKTTSPHRSIDEINAEEDPHKALLEEGKRLEAEFKIKSKQIREPDEMTMKEFKTVTELLNRIKNGEATDEALDKYLKAQSFDVKAVKKGLDIPEKIIPELTPEQLNNLLREEAKKKFPDLTPEEIDGIIFGIG